MIKEKISNLEIGVLQTYLLKSFILINGINILINYNMNDSIISILIAFIIGLFFISILTKNKFSIFKQIDNSFSRVFSYIIKIILIICVFIYCSYLIYTSSLFIKSTLLSNMDILPISILLIISIYYLVNKGITTITKTSFICFFIFIILEIMTFLFLTPHIDSLKILPLFKYNIKTTLFNSFNYIILSFSPLFLILSIPKEKINNNSNNKYIKIFFIITNLYILFNFILVFCIIDVKLAKIIDYPEIFILSKISELNFFDRLEGILSFKLIFDLFFTISLSLYYLKEGITSFFNKTKHKYIKYILLISITILLLLSNLIKFNNYLLFISLFIFRITNIIIYIKNRKSNY